MIYYDLLDQQNALLESRQEVIDKSDDIRDRRHEDLVKEVNDMSDVLMEVKGSVSRINGSR